MEVITDEYIEHVEPIANTGKRVGAVAWRAMAAEINKLPPQERGDREFTGPQIRQQWVNKVDTVRNKMGPLMVRGYEVEPEDIMPDLPA